MNLNLIWGKVDWARWTECKNEDNYMWTTFAIGYSLHIVQNSYISENVVRNYFFFWPQQIFANWNVI